MRENCCWCLKSFDERYINTHIQKGKCRSLPKICRELMRSGASWDNAIFINDYLTFYGHYDFNNLMDKVRKAAVADKKQGTKLTF